MNCYSHDIKRDNDIYNARYLKIKTYILLDRNYFDYIFFYMGPKPSKDNHTPNLHTLTRYLPLRSQSLFCSLLRILTFH